MRPEPDTDHDGVIFDRLAEGSLSIPEQRQLAARLRAEPDLRRRLRRWARLTGALVSTAGALPAEPAAPHRSRTRPRVAPLTMVRFALAASVVLGIATALVMLAGRTATTDERENVALAATVVAADGTFAPSLQPSRLRLPDRPHLELDADSSGLVMVDTHDRDPGIRLDSGSIELGGIPGDQRQVRIETGPASIAANGRVAVRYLEVPSGQPPAIEVSVTHGSARIDARSGTRKYVQAGEARVIAPGNVLHGEVERIDGNLVELSLVPHHSHHRWIVESGKVQISDTAGAPLPPAALEAGWKVVLHLADGTRVASITVPDQIRTGTVVAWEATGRRLTIRRTSGTAPETWRVATNAPTDLLRNGSAVRLTIDARSRLVERVTAGDQRVHAGR